MDETNLPSKVWKFISRNLIGENSGRIILNKKIIEEEIIRFINRSLERDEEWEGWIDLKDKELLSKIIINLIEENLSIECLSEVLNWVQFEYLCARIFELNEFDYKIHYCFREGGKRFEIDILGYRSGVILAADVKHWSARQGKRKRLIEYAEKQDFRVKALIQSLKFKEDYIQLPVKHVTPLIITLYDENIEFHNGVPIIPVYKLNNFLNGFELYDLKTYHI